MGTAKGTTGTNTVARVANDLGMAAWFGASLMDAVGLDPLAQRAGDAGTIRSARHRTFPMEMGAWGAAVVGATRLARENRGRLGRQAGVARVAATKTLLLALASSTTVLAGALEARKSPPASAVRLLHATTAVLTGKLLIADARLGEQQRPLAVAWIARIRRRAA